jgi:hypothetical protein
MTLDPSLTDYRPVNVEPSLDSAAGPAQLRSGDYELRFRSLHQSGRGYGFPCDVHGWVDLDNLSERQRTAYLYVRAVIGREFDTPTVLLRRTG